RQEGGSSKPIEIASPAITHHVEVSIGDLTGDTAPLTLAVIDANVSGGGLSKAETASINDSLTDVVGTRGSGRIDSDGHLHQFELSIGDLPGATAPLTVAVVGSNVSCAGLSKAETAAINVSLTDVVGTRGSGRIDSDGRLHQFEWTGLDDADATVRDGMEAI